MPWLKDISYDRQATITAFRDYYHFLTALYLHQSEVVEPPQRGWPAITAENMQGVQKSAEVVELLRYLPVRPLPVAPPREAAVYHRDRFCELAGALQWHRRRPLGRRSREACYPE